MSDTTTAKAVPQQVPTQVATSLYRADKTAIYYVIFNCRGRQVKRSLRTTSKELVRCRLDEFCREVAL
jgi:hypothetical protein